MRKTILFIMLFFSANILFCGQKQDAPKKDQIKKAEVENVKKEEVQKKSEKFRFSGLKLKAMDGSIVDFDEIIDGKVVILDLWDTWCPPCKKEIPGFIDMQKKYGDKGLLVIGIAFARFGFEKVKEFTESNNINYPIYIPADDAQGRKYFSDIRSIPTTFVINTENMEIVNTHLGFKPQSVFEEEIKPFLE